MYVIYPVSKSPYPTGRVGAVEKQDWYRGLVKARELSQRLPNSRILIVSATRILGEKSDVWMYLAGLQSLNVAGDQKVVLDLGHETVGQIEAAVAYASQVGGKLVVVSTFLHYPRVRWICRGITAEHHIVFGIPRPREVLTDLALMVLFPVIDILGGRDWFVRKVRARRERGRL